VGQSKPAVQILLYTKWAHASACAHLYSGCCGPMQANNPNITVHEMGPFGGLEKRAFRLLWPNSTSSARSQYSHHGPMRAPFSAAILLTANDEGPYGSLAQQPIVYLMGQSEPAVQILQHMKWAHASACARLYSGCCGPMQANNPNITVYEMGPFGGLTKRAFRLLWLN